MLYTLRLKDGHPKGPGQKTGQKNGAVSVVDGFEALQKEPEEKRGQKRRRRWKITWNDYILIGFNRIYSNRYII